MTKRLWLIGLVLVLAAPLVFLLRGFVQDVLLVELLRFLWVMRILFDSLPQVLVWGMFLLIVLSVAVKSLMAGKWPVGGEPKAAVKHEGQVQFLAKRIRRATRGEYFAWDLGRQLGKLIVDLLAYSQGLAPDQIRWRVRYRLLDLPEEIRPYLEGGQAAAYSLARLKEYLSASLRPPSPDSSLETVVQFLEDQLEV